MQLDTKWVQYFTKRFSLVSGSGLAAGIAFSAFYIAGVRLEFLPFLLSFIGILAIEAALCLMDDIKDFEKDKIAYPNLPLPKGLITKQEAIHMLEVVRMTLFVYGLFVWVVLNSVGALSYFVLAAYFWLMEKDFGSRQWLSRHPLISGCLYHLIFILMACFAVTAVRPVIPSSLWSFALLLFGSFFCRDICSKLNPHAHPILATYIHFYGFRVTFNVAALTLMVSAMGAFDLGLGYFLIPCELLVLSALSAVFFQPSLFPIPQVLANISLMLHVWAVALFHVIGS